MNIDEALKKWIAKSYCGGGEDSEDDGGRCGMGAFEVSSGAEEVDLYDAEGNSEKFDGATSTRGGDSNRGVRNVHRNSGTSVLEGAYKGIEDVGGVEHKNGAGSGSGLQYKSLSDEWRINGKRAGARTRSRGCRWHLGAEVRTSMIIPSTTGE